jgi:hypothetical protein
VEDTFTILIPRSNDEYFAMATADIDTARIPTSKDVLPAVIRAVTTWVKTTGPALQQYWLNHKRMGKASRAVLQVLIDAYPNPVDRVTLGEQSGYSAASSTFRGALTPLYSMHLIEKDGDGLKAHPDLFD